MKTPPFRSRTVCSHTLCRGGRWPLRRCATAPRALWQGCGSHLLLSRVRLCSASARAARRVLARRRYVKMLQALRARRVRELQESDEQGELEGIGLRKQQLFQAVEGLQDAAGEWLIARAVQQDEGEPAWLVRAGQELELMLQQWQQRQEERLDMGSGRRSREGQRACPGTGAVRAGGRPTTQRRRSSAVGLAKLRAWKLHSLHHGNNQGHTTKVEDSAECGCTWRCRAGVA